MSSNAATVDVITILMIGALKTKDLSSYLPDELAMSWKALLRNIVDTMRMRPQSSTDFLSTRSSEGNLRNDRAPNKWQSQSCPYSVIYSKVQQESPDGGNDQESCYRKSLQPERWHTVYGPQEQAKAVQLGDKTAKLGADYG